MSDIFKGLEKLGSRPSFRPLTLTYEETGDGVKACSLSQAMHLALAYRRQVERRQERVQYCTWLLIYRARLCWLIGPHLLNVVDLRTALDLVVLHFDIIPALVIPSICIRIHCRPIHPEPCYGSNEKSCFTLRSTPYSPASSWLLEERP